MAVEVSLCGDGCRLVLRVERYAYPDVTSGTDANWLAAEVELTAGRTGAFRATHRIALRTDELVQFRGQLRLLDRDASGEAYFEHLEEQVGVTVRLSAGRGTMSLVVRELLGPELRFADVAIDPALIRQAVDELDAAAEAFPARH